jgi:imidazolonepropionase
MTIPIQADLLITDISQLVTATGTGPKHGSAMRELRIVERACFAITNGRVIWSGPASDWSGHADAVINVGDRAVVPALVDPHTHAVWADDRLADFEARASGVTYEDILRAGGGIRSSICATSSSQPEKLAALARPRIEALLHSGAATIEVKSGYGFEPPAELMMLEAIQALRKTCASRIVPTLLIHIPPPNPKDRAGYVAEISQKLIPEVAARRLAVAVDVFVEQEAWHPEEAVVIFEAAKECGLGIKLHSEQFHRIGGLELAVKMGALSVDHLETCGADQFPLLASSGTIATVLPGVSLHLGIPAAPGRKLIDAGAAVAVGTDLNPGSSPMFSMAMALGLSVRLNGLSPAEALSAGTVNAASALGLSDTGRLEPGMRADFLVLEERDWRSLVYTLGSNPVREVWIDGKRVGPPTRISAEAS